MSDVVPKPPRLPSELDEEEVGVLAHDAAYSDVALSEVVGSDQHADGVHFNTVRLTEVNLSGSHLDRLRLTDGELLRCGAARLATSDHPVVPVPLGDGGMVPLNAVPQGGALNTLEIRFALSPRLLLLMTWLDEFQSEPIVKMKIDQVRNHNATVIQQADSQWFHVPGHPPERMAGPWPPFSYVLHGPRHDPRGQRWHQVRHAIDEMSDAKQSEKDMRLIEWGVSRTAARHTDAA